MLPAASSDPQLLHSAFKRKSGSKNGSPGGLRGQIQAEGADVQGGHCCLVLFPPIREVPRWSPESSTGKSRETEKGLRGSTIELPPQNSRSPTFCPHSSRPLRLRVPMVQPCGPHKPTLRPPHPDSVFSTQTWKETSVTHRPQRPHWSSETASGATHGPPLRHQ